MVVVIQCAATKRKNAGHLRCRDGRNVMFVANPDAAGASDRLVYARPDDFSDTVGESWRSVLREYNKHPRKNRHGLLPAWQLYDNPIYGRLKEHFGLDGLYILSAGWGLVSASCLIPNYDITFSGAEKVMSLKRRHQRDCYRDFCTLPSNVDGPIVFLGGKDYRRLFLKLTVNVQNERIVFYAGKKPSGLGCTVRTYRESYRNRNYRNWHYRCAEALMEGKIRLDCLTERGLSQSCDG
ncbi:MAG: hypothetical protein OXN97_13190 [Bryobacterales bacterium]|nr:hypothetical protein [Bryobacterales bacterium]